jgi:miniconductance mechanosensitive channel
LHKGVLRAFEKRAQASSICGCKSSPEQTVSPAGLYPAGIIVNVQAVLWLQKAVKPPIY